MNRGVSFFLLIGVTIGLWLWLDRADRPPVPTSPGGAPMGETIEWDLFFRRYLLATLPLADRFDFPVKPPNGNGAFIGRSFGAGGHAGEDWNTAIGDKDLGEPIFSPADGWVSLAMDFQGAWGKVVLVDYRLPGSEPTGVEMMFAHLDRMDVAAGQKVRRGQRLGTMGNANGVYAAHLHWETRLLFGLGLGGGYADDLKPWTAPSEFVAAHRGVEIPAKTPGPVRLSADQWDKWGGD